MKAGAREPCFTNKETGAQVLSLEVMPSGMQFVGDTAGFSPQQAVLLTKDENEPSLSAGVDGLVLGLSAVWGPLPYILTQPLGHVLYTDEEMETWRR